MINIWLLPIFLTCIAIPGIWIAMPRFIRLLLPANSVHLQRRFTALVVTQSVLMVFFMGAAGAFLSSATGLGDSLLYGLLGGKNIFNTALSMILPVFIFTLAGLAVFLLVFYALGRRLLDEATLLALKRLRGAFGLDGCMLYSGVSDEILSRWGLMTICVFFTQFFLGYQSDLVMWTAMIIVTFLYTMGHYPAFIAIGCKNSRSFMLLFVLLAAIQNFLFGWIFWQFGILAAIIAHMMFHLGWYLYDPAP